MVWPVVEEVSDTGSIPIYVEEEYFIRGTLTPKVRNPENIGFEKEEMVTNQDNP